VILVVLYDVSHGHFGGLYAAPVFSEIASAALQRLEVAPLKTSPAYDTASLLPFTGGETAPAGVAALGDTSDNSIPSDGSEPAEADVAPAYKVATAGIVPEFRGESLRGAFAIARAHGVEIETSGDGYVIGQDPPPGAPSGGGAIQLTFAENGAEPPTSSSMPHKSSHHGQTMGPTNSHIRSRSAR
jgi:hypothetical protein